MAMPPLYRIDVGKNVYYALADQERGGILARLMPRGSEGRSTSSGSRGWGEKPPAAARDHMDPNTRRLVQLTLDDADIAVATIDMLLAKGRAADRKEWLTEEGNKAEILD